MKSLITNRLPHLIAGRLGKLQIKTPGRGEGTVIGELARAGLFFMENGEVRSMQELDLAARLQASAGNGGDEEQRDVIADWSRAADSALPRLDTIEDAVMALQRLIIRRRNQMISFTRRALIAEEKKESLLERFWQWQEEYANQRSLRASLVINYNSTSRSRGRRG